MDGTISTTPYHFFSYVGSYEGAIKIGGKWVRFKNLNYVNKAGWIRHQGPPTAALEVALKNPVALDARKYAF